MKKMTIGDLQLWQFENLSNEPSIKHFVTSRNPLSSREEFTLSYSSSPEKDKIRHNRIQLASAINIREEELYFPSQVHRTRIVHVTRKSLKEELLETDALITNEKGICIAVMSADCVTILLYDKRNQAIGAVHSGWRGTVARILEKTLKQMSETFGTKGEDLVAAIGPSVCQDSYEVGEEVVEAVHNAFGKESGLTIPQPTNKAKLDLWKANKLQLTAFGVPESRIEISGLCTVKNNNDFFSARKGDTGRFAAGVLINR
jgi:hypothetical protein